MTTRAEAIEKALRECRERIVYTLTQSGYSPLAVSQNVAPIDEALALPADPLSAEVEGACENLTRWGDDWLSPMSPARAYIRTLVNFVRSQFKGGKTVNQWKCLCPCEHDPRCIACENGDCDMHQVPEPSTEWGSETSAAVSPETTCTEGARYEHANPILHVTPPPPSDRERAQQVVHDMQGIRWNNDWVTRIATEFAAVRAEAHSQDCRCACYHRGIEHLAIVHAEAQRDQHEREKLLVAFVAGQVDSRFLVKDKPEIVRDEITRLLAAFDKAGQERKS